MRFRRRQPLDGLTLSNRKAMAFERKKKREQGRLLEYTGHTWD